MPICFESAAQGIGISIEVVAKALNAPLGIHVLFDHVESFVDLRRVDCSLLAFQRRVFEYLQGFENSHGVELASHRCSYSVFSPEISFK